VTEIHTKTKTSFYRRIYLAYLIESGCNTPKAIVEATEMPRRTLQDTIKALSDLEIVCQAQGGTKAMHYTIESWGPIDKSWIQANLADIKDVLQYP